MKTKPIYKSNEGKIPSKVSEADVLYILETQDINYDYLRLMKESTSFGDQEISYWLNVSPRTLQNYKTKKTEFKENLKEHLIHLISLFNHGVQVFGDQKQFEEWLGTPNFFFDSFPKPFQVTKSTPLSYLNKISGIRFVDDRLTAMEFGDNV